MKSDIPIYIGIVLVIAAFVVGFTAWKVASPNNRRPEKALYLCLAVFCGTGFVLISVQALLVWRGTGIDVMRGDYWRLAKVGALAAGGVVGYRMWKRREVQESDQRHPSGKMPNKALQPTTMAGTPRAPSSTSRAGHGRG